MARSHVSMIEAANGELMARGLLKLRDVSGRQLAMSQQINDPQTQRFTERFQLVETGRRLKTVFIHGAKPD